MASRELCVKLVLLGDAGVGKTSIVVRYVQGTFGDVKSTIAASFISKRLLLDGWNVKLQIWDTAGQERFRSMAPMYYRGATAAVLVLDSTSRSSFVSMQDWVGELQKQGTTIALAIACNKVDLADRRVVTREEVDTFAKSVGAIVRETSAKTSEGVEFLFKDLVDALIKRMPTEGQSDTGRGSTAELNTEDQEEKKSGCC